MMFILYESPGLVKILIVEDDLMIADLLEESLTSAGFTVCGIAQNAAIAIEEARRHRPALVIIDINLGVGDLGTVIPGRLKPAWPLGVLFATGNGHMEQLSSAGGTAIIHKPYSMADMIVALQIVQDIVAAGSTSRPMPHGMRLLPGAGAFALARPVL